MTDEFRAYVVEQVDSHFAVIGPNGYEACRCSTSDQAAQYAALLNQAYRVGYKAGYREAKTMTSRER